MGGRREDPRSDVALLRGADSDPAAFSELYARHVDAVHAWLRRRIEWAASDLTAETFARAWLIRERFRDERQGSILPWLLGIARNLLGDAVRQQRIETRARERLGLPLDLATEDGYADVERRLSPCPELGRELQALSPNDRDALNLRIVDELPYEEIARRLSIRPAAARLRVSRTLRRLASAVPREQL